MGWSYDKSSKTWKCSRYSDLQYAEITNLAEYGQPMNPHESGFLQDLVPDFGDIKVEMPQSEVMTFGYGKDIKADQFPVVKRFLKEKLSFPTGKYTFDALKRGGFAKEKERWISTNLYGFGSYGITAGAINPGDAAYIHGSVSFALQATTSFSYEPHLRQVDAWIGAGDDNWDFESANVPRILNATVAAIFGPDHYNLTAPIQILFRGVGKRSGASRVY